MPGASQPFLLTAFELDLWTFTAEMGYGRYNLRGDSISPWSSVLNSSLNFISFDLQSSHPQTMLHQSNSICLGPWIICLGLKVSKSRNPKPHSMAYFNHKWTDQLK